MTNVKFVKGEIENILPDDSVDAIISNCVINLSANKDRVLSEAFRLLKPDGLFAVSDNRGARVSEPLQTRLNFFHPFGPKQKSLQSRPRP